METLSSIPGYEDKLPIYTEKETTENLRQFQLLEREYDDLFRAEQKLRDFLNDSQNDTKNRPAFVAKLDNFRTILNAVKLAYIELAKPGAMR